MRTRGRTTTLAGAALVVLVAAATAGAPRPATVFKCVEKQTPRRSCFAYFDDAGRRQRLCGVTSVASFTATLRLPMKDLGPLYKKLGANAALKISLGSLQYDGRLANADWKYGRPSAKFVLVGGSGDPDAGEGPPAVTARVRWTRTLATVTIVGHEPILLPVPGEQSVAVDELRPMSVTFAATQADIDLRLTGAVTVRQGDDGFGDGLPIQTVRLRGAGTIKAP